MSMEEGDEDLRQDVDDEDENDWQHNADGDGDDRGDGPHDAERECDPAIRRGARRLKEWKNAGKGT